MNIRQEKVLLYSKQLIVDFFFSISSMP